MATYTSAEGVKYRHLTRDEIKALRNLAKEIARKEGHNRAQIEVRRPITKTAPVFSNWWNGGIQDIEDFDTLYRFENRMLCPVEGKWCTDLWVGTCGSRWNEGGQTLSFILMEVQDGVITKMEEA